MAISEVVLFIQLPLPWSFFCLCRQSRFTIQMTIEYYSGISGKKLFKQVTYCGHFDLDVNHCLPNPCKNEGNCYATKDGYHCTCVKGFKGPNCDSKCEFYIEHVKFT